MYMYTCADLYLAFITYVSESFPFQYMEANLFLSIVCEFIINMYYSLSIFL